jgi:uncharacterized protein (DUF1778 family)
MTAAKSGETRDHRWNVRVEDSEDALVRAASDLTDTKFSSFVRVAAVSEARRVLADRTQFSLQGSEWEQFTQLLDRPPQVPRGLRKLFSRPSVFQ